MRNVAILTLTLIIALAGGCGGKGKRAEKALAKTAARSQQIVLEEGYQALETKQYNDAIAKADEFLAGQPHGEGSPEALYLKGRALEAKNAAGVTAEEAKANLQSARSAYIAAVGQNPKQPLNAYLRTSLGNVAYFQDDYNTAIAQLTAAYDNLDSTDLKAWCLYRIGLSQQRQGKFEDADKSFALVQQHHAGTVPAQRAHDRQGARAFYVQLATFAQPASADRAIADLKKQGVTATRVASPEGHALLRVGPIASYTQAAFMKDRFTEKYPDAVIIP
jgi:TolA-binding protein